MPPAALTFSSHILKVTSCFLASSETAPVSPSGAPILMSAALTADAVSGLAARAAAKISAPEYLAVVHRIVASIRIRLRKTQIGDCIGHAKISAPPRPESEYVASSRAG